MHHLSLRLVSYIARYLFTPPPPPKSDVIKLIKNKLGDKFIYIIGLRDNTEKWST